MYMRLTLTDTLIDTIRIDIETWHVRLGEVETDSNRAMLTCLCVSKGGR